MRPVENNPRSDSEPPHQGCRTALLTPPGRGAVATVALAGAAAADCLRQRFVSARNADPSRLAFDRIYFGRWHVSPVPLDGDAPDEAAAAQPSEEVVIRRRGPYEFEIHCHGGRAASERIIDSLVSLGAVRFAPRQWLETTLADPLQADAVAALAEARTMRTAGVLLAQSQGALHEALAKVVAALRGGELPAAAARLARLQQLAPLGLHLTVPWRVVLAGPPNVGKSSLANTLLGFDRCIVLDQPGTTRDIVSTTTALDGWPVELLDTAGLRSSSDDVELRGVELARACIGDADLVLLVRDASQPGLDDEVDSIRRQPNMLTVWNKIDLGPAELGDVPDALPVSARTGAGIDELITAVVQRLIPHLPHPDEAVPFTPAIAVAVSEAHAAAVAGKPAAAIATLAALGIR